MSNNSGAESQFKTLTVLQASKRLFPFARQSKVTARPERVVVWHVHEILESSPMVRSGDVNARVNARQGQLFHYKRGITVTNTTTVSRMSDFASLLLRRLYVATATVCLTGDY